jgi:hypothetical protein
VVTTHGHWRLLPAPLALAQVRSCRAGRVGAGALTTNGALKVTSAAPDAARTLASDGLADSSDYNPACAPNHDAGGEGSCAGGRGFQGRPACNSSTTAACGVGAAAPCARAGA